MLSWAKGNGRGGEGEVRFEFALLQFAQSCRDQITPAGGVLVEEVFCPEVFLEPVLSEMERAATRQTP